MALNEMQFVDKWWKAPGHEPFVRELNKRLIEDGEEAARRFALGALPEQLVTVAWRRFWEGRTK